MVPPSPLPQFVYKIVSEAPPESQPEQYPLSQLDKKDGFVHLSVGQQIPHTAALFFKDASTLWVMKLVLGDELKEKMNWDIPQCPHLYWNFGAKDVNSVRRFDRSANTTWDTQGVMDREWLE
ncbi:hypothetical protein MKZ38_004863 [Zalerion maritima]|uniref:DUF952 domain-containing protein n=1 Tax=Zalerion maritima TaxID=339359 RepID=A0AAD5RRM6_9PEZI|nr:hypothetical protein MKZ38_004863 [Zalerion maritima]